MSSLARYKKSGGFFQLLSLIETFGPQKKEKFLEMIDQESPVWASALRDKMLSLERIFTWPDQVVIEVFKRLPPKSQAFALTGLKDEQKAKITPLLSSADQRRLNDVLTESQPKPEEVQTTLVKMVELSRRLLNDRELNAEKFDPGLVIPEAFESKLEEQAVFTAPVGGREPSPTVERPDVVVPSPAPAAGGTPNHSAEVLQLQRTLAVSLKENKALKDEVKALREKLDHIRKFAA